VKSCGWRLLLKSFAILICGIILGFLLLLAVYSLPIAPMAKNVKASIPALNGEWASEGPNEQLVPGYLTTQLDNSTDAAMMLHAVHESEQTLTMRAVQGSRYISEGSAFHTLQMYGEVGSEGLESFPVSRYWHGYLLFLKPLLMVFSYMDIRMLLTIVQGCMMTGVIAGLCRRRLGRLTPCFILSLLCITPMAAGFSLQYSTAFCTLLGAMLLLLYLPPSRFDGNRLSIFFLLVGMFTSFVDYLTYPVATFGMPFVLCVFLFPANKVADEWKRFIACGLCWALGYFGMWAGKWILAGIFGREPWFWANLLAKISERSSDVTGQVRISYFDVLKAVLSIFVKRVYLMVGVVAVVGWIAMVIRGRCKGYSMPSAAPGKWSVLACVALLPFAWFFCTQNHTYNHAYFTARTVAVSAFAATALLTCLTPMADERLAK